MSSAACSKGDARRIRVLFVENGIGYGGAIICLRHLVRNLDRSRFEPMVVTGRNGPEYAGMEDEAPWRHINDRLVDVVGFKARLEQAHWPDVIPGLRWLIGQFVARTDDLCNFLPFFLRLLWTAARFRPDLVHANNEPLCNRAALLVAKALRTPSVCHVRGPQQGSQLMLRMYSLPDHFIPVSHWVSQSIGNLGIPENRRTVVYDGIELEKLPVDADGNRFRQRHGIAPDAYAVGLVGLLIAWKGQEIFMSKTARQLTRAFPSCAC